MAATIQGDIPGAPYQETAYLPSHAAATATEVVPIFVAKQNCRIRKVSVVAGAAVTGQDTNTTNLNLHDRAADGAGTTEKANYDLTLGNDLAAHDEKILYQPATPFSLDAGRVLAIQFEKVGTGLLTPQMLAVVEYDLNRAS
jgi:hypothetical protein